MTTPPSGRTIVGATAALEGATLVTFCACSQILVDRHDYDLSAAAYAMLFLLQLVAAVLAVVFAAYVARPVSRGIVLRVGLASSLTAMLLLIVTSLIGDRQVSSYPLLLVASISLGAGFGLTYPAVTGFSMDADPRLAERAVLRLNLMFAAGMVAVPVLGLIFVHAGIWWLLPTLLAIAVALVLAAATGPWLGPDANRPAARIRPAHRMPARLKLYPLPVLAVGAAAVLCVAWPQIAARPATAHPATRAFLLGAFWAGLVMLGRVGFATIDRRQSWRRTATAAAFLLPAVVVLIGVTADQIETAIIGIFLLAAVACAAFLPLPVHPGRDQLSLLMLVVVAGVLTLYPLGLGIAAQSLNSMEHSGASLLLVFAVATGVAVIAGLVSAGILARRTPGPWDCQGPATDVRRTPSGRSASTVTRRRLVQLALAR
jgi:MFS family permease